MIYCRNFNYANYVATCLEKIGSAERTNVESGKNINNIIMMKYLVKYKCNKYRNRL